jgi:hypothetical protein
MGAAPSTRYLFAGYTLYKLGNVLLDALRSPLDGESYQFFLRISFNACLQAILGGTILYTCYSENALTQLV